MAEQTKKHTILLIEIVEDEASLRNALHDKFAHEGFNVLRAKDGDEGIEIALREQPDLILLDIAMPKLDGISMMRKLRTENQWGRHVPIILLTNLSPDNELMNREINENQPAFYLVKSDWKIDDVVKKAREVLK